MSSGRMLSLLAVGFTLLATESALGARSNGPGPGPDHGRVNDDQSQTARVTRTTASGVVYTILRAGTGRQLKTDDFVCVRMHGFSDDGTVVEANRANGDLLVVGFVERSRQPKGLREGLLQLHIGDLAVVVVPRGQTMPGNGEPIVKAGSSLVYVVDIVEVKTRELGQVINKTLETKGTVSALEEFLKLKAAGFQDVYASEWETDHVGFNLLNHGDVKGAIQVFQSNVESYPHSAMACASLGDAYLMAGDKDLALINYRKAQAIDPAFDIPLEIIDHLPTSPSKLTRAQSSVSP